MSGLREWLETRTPPAPEAFRDWLDRNGSSNDFVGILCEAVRESIREVAARPGRNREAAFHLLAADAFATYACEAATEGAEFDGELLRILERIQRRPD